MTARLVMSIISMVLLSRTAIAGRCDNPRECLTREGRTTLITQPHKRNYERKLFVTPDEIARYLFLTNAPNDGDRSAAIYRASGKSGSLPGAYWVTATEASDSLIETTRGISVRRSDAPLPASTAVAIHRLWVAFLEATREEKDTIICSPTGIFAATPSGGTRLTGGTWTIPDEGCLCHDLLNLGEELVGYPHLPGTKRAEAARKIEETSHALFRRVWRAKGT